MAYNSKHNDANGEQNRDGALLCCSLKACMLGLRFEGSGGALYWAEGDVTAENELTRILLADLVAYSLKHNDANCAQHRDGALLSCSLKSLYAR